MCGQKDELPLSNVRSGRVAFLGVNLKSSLSISIALGEKRSGGKRRGAGDAELLIDASSRFMRAGWVSIAELHWQSGLSS